jgi:hypothetical protein
MDEVIMDEKHLRIEVRAYRLGEARARAGHRQEKRRGYDLLAALLELKAEP